MIYVYSSLSIILCFIISFFITSKIFKLSSPLSYTLKSSFSGILTLTILNIVSNIISISIPINYISLGISTMMGIPGIIIILILNCILIV